jgi:type I restriction enzyme, S subunit
VVKIGSVKPGIIDLNQVSFVSEKIANQLSRFRLSEGDLLIGMTGYVGEVGIVSPTHNLPLLNQRVGHFLLPKQGTEFLGFWFCTTRQIEFKAFVEAHSHGTAQANVSSESIMEFPITLPSSKLLVKFNHFCKPILEKFLKNHAQNFFLSRNC